MPTKTPLRLNSHWNYETNIASDIEVRVELFYFFTHQKFFFRSKKNCEGVFSPSHREKKGKSERAYFIRKKKRLPYVEAEFQLCDHRARKFFSRLNFQFKFFFSATRNELIDFFLLAMFLFVHKTETFCGSKIYFMLLFVDT